jgi:hypothetical protein
MLNYLQWQHSTRQKYGWLHAKIWAGYRSRYSDWLRAGRSGDRIPVKARFSAPVQTGHGVPPSLLYNGYRVFPGGRERPGRDADPSPPSSAFGHERVDLYSPHGPYGLYKASVPVQGWPLPLPFCTQKCRKSKLDSYLNTTSNIA